MSERTKDRKKEINQSIRGKIARYEAAPIGRLGDCNQLSARVPPFRLAGWRLADSGDPHLVWFYLGGLSSYVVRGPQVGWGYPRRTDHFTREPDAGNMSGRELRGALPQVPGTVPPRSPMKGTRHLSRNRTTALSTSLTMTASDDATATQVKAEGLLK